MGKVLESEKVLASWRVFIAARGQGIIESTRPEISVGPLALLAHARRYLAWYVAYQAAQ